MKDQNEKILVVDDNFADRELLKEILLTSTVEYDIRLAESGIEALEKVKVDPPDLILLDIQMKEKTGFDVLQDLNAQDESSIPVLLVSSFTNEDDRLKGLELGATDFISKPIIPEEVKARAAVQLRLKKTYDNLKWVTQKTNDGIKTLYKELEKKNEELNKMDQVKSEFVSTVSHELRTPLAISTEGLSLLLDGIPGGVNEKQEKILSKSKSNLERLARLIDDLLDMSKIEAGKMTLIRKFVNFSEIINEFIDSYQTVVRTKNVDLTLKAPGENIYLYVDRDKIIQCITNLVHNAYKFTAEGGKIEVEITVHDTKVLCSVKDTGVGMSQEDVRKLFNKFEQFGRKEGPGTKGTGLGLSITKALIELHGGEIQVESVPNQGTTFQFSLPIYEQYVIEFEEKVENMINDFNEQKEPCAFIAISLKNFDQILQKYGQEETTKIMNSIVGATEISSEREDHLVILNDPMHIYMFLPKTNRVDVGEQIKNIKNSTLTTETFVNGERIDIHLNFGFAVSPDNGKSRSDLVNAALEHLNKRKNVLIVDDHPQVARLLSTRLENYGFHTSSANNGKQALQLVDESRPDLIILDILMPEMNGYEVYGRLKENPETAYIPIVLLTTQELDVGKIESITPTSIPIIEKSGGFENILEVVDDLL